MDWTQEQILLSQAPTLGVALAEMSSYFLDGIPLSTSALTTPGVNPMAGFPTTGFVDPMADLIVGPPAASPPGFAGMPLSGPIAPAYSGPTIAGDMPAPYDPMADRSR